MSIGGRHLEFTAGCLAEILVSLERVVPLVIVVVVVPLVIVVGVIGVAGSGEEGEDVGSPEFAIGDWCFGCGRRVECGAGGGGGGGAGGRFGDGGGPGGGPGFRFRSGFGFRPRFRFRGSVIFLFLFFFFFVPIFLGASFVNLEDPQKSFEFLRWELYDIMHMSGIQKRHSRK